MYVPLRPRDTISLTTSVPPCRCVPAVAAKRGSHSLPRVGTPEHLTSRCAPPLSYLDLADLPVLRAGLCALQAGDVGFVPASFGKPPARL